MRFDLTALCQASTLITDMHHAITNSANATWEV